MMTPENKGIPHKDTERLLFLHEISYLSIDVLDVGTGIAGKSKALRSLLHHQQIGTVGTKEVHCDW